MKVIINGQDSSVRGDGLPKIADVVELIKASIDPEHMITGILINGKELQEQDWTATTTEFGTAIIEVETGTPESFVTERMGLASNVVRECYLRFRDSRKEFQDGKMQQGNHKLIEAVHTAQAFFEWYGALMALVPQERKSAFDITPQVYEISAICKRICQQQLYQSWWALGETLEKELEPKLDSLEDFCRGFALQA